MEFASFIVLSEMIQEHDERFAVWGSFMASLEENLRSYIERLPYEESLAICELALNEAPVSMASGRDRGHFSRKKRVNFSDQDLEAAAKGTHRLWQVYAGIRRAWDRLGLDADPQDVYNFMVNNKQPLMVNDNDNKAAIIKRINVVRDEVSRNRLTPFRPDFAANLERQLVKRGTLDEPEDQKGADAQQRMMQRSVSRWKDEVGQFLGSHDKPNKLGDEDYENFPSPYYTPDYHASEAQADPKKIKFYQSPKGQEAYKRDVLDVACRATYGQIVSAMRKWWGITPVPPAREKGALCGIGQIKDSRMADFMKGISFKDLVEKSAQRILDFTGHPKYPYEAFRMQVAKWPVMRVLYDRAKKANIETGKSGVPSDWPGARQPGGSMQGGPGMEPAPYKGPYGFARTPSRSGGRR